MKHSDTICALSTPYGTGGIAVIRVSGDMAFSIVNKVYKGKFKSFEDLESHKVSLGSISDCDGHIIDEVLVTKFFAPNSFTGEDVVEISCHGGTYVVKLIIDSLISKGARSATGGEFSKRAFLNGKMDLSRAEAIIDIINAKDEYNVYSGENQLKGILSDKILKMREALIDIVSNIMAIIDYPDEEIDSLKTEEIISVCQKVLYEAEALKDSYKTGKIIKDGIGIVICGKPNVGKSSLLNALLRDDRAIVTDIAGTTRDTLEEELTIDGLKARITDTAGIHSSKDTVENLGIEKAKSAIEKADIVLFILDGSIPLSEEDLQIARDIKDKNVFIAVNKNDLPLACDFSPVKEIIPDAKYIELSAKNKNGISELAKEIKKSVLNSEIDIKNDIYITNERHMEQLIHASNYLNEAINSLKSGIFADIVTIDLENAIESLGKITGQTVSEEVIANIFKKFCVGK